MSTKNTKTDDPTDKTEKEVTTSDSPAQDAKVPQDPPPADDDQPDSVDLPPHVSTVIGDTATITPVNPKDTPALARLLLDAATNPTEVRTITTPHGWQVPVAVATKAGLI